MSDTVKTDAQSVQPFGPATDFAEDCMRWRGRILTGRFAHWCFDWDGLPVDETTGDEFDCCTCYSSASCFRLTTEQS